MMKEVRLSDVLFLFLILGQSNGNKKTIVPDVIVQFGIPRTATTLQYRILCVMMAVVHEDEKESVRCNFNGTKSHKYTVIKTHELLESRVRSLPNGTWIFMTYSDKLAAKAKDRLLLTIDMVRQNNITIPFIAETKLVSERGYFIAYEYQAIFGISDALMKHIIDYLQYWEILRRCCGKQMSSDWLNHLSPMENYRPHHDIHSATYPACEMYIISNVEKHFMNTYIYKRFAKTKSLKYSIGGPYDGSFCERCNDNIIKKRLQFNEDCQ